jgi:hypothetical protein
LKVSELYASVEVRDGKFHRLFNVLLLADDDDPSHENFGVPEYHQPLQLQMGRHTYSLARSVRLTMIG